MDLFTKKKYENFETKEIENKISFLNNKIELSRKEILKKTNELENSCIEVIELIELLDDRKNKTS
jgi:hypothetical protein